MALKKKKGSVKGKKKKGKASAKQKKVKKNQVAPDPASIAQPSYIPDQDIWEFGSVGPFLESKGLGPAVAAGKGSKKTKGKKGAKTKGVKKGKKKKKK